MKQLITISLLVLAIMMLASCGSESDKSAQLDFGLEFQPPVGKTVAATPADVCSEYGIASVVGIVKNSSGAEVTRQTWPCSSHSGTFSGLPTGSGFTFLLEGMTTGNSVGWRGTQSNVTLTAGQANNVGTIPMNYVAAIPTRAIIRLSSDTTTNIEGLQLNLTLPAGVSIAADGSGIPNAGKVTASGVASGSYLTSRYVGGVLQLVIANSSGFGAGEFVTIDADIAGSSTIQFSNGFSVSNLQLSGRNGVTLSGVNVSRSMTLQ